jgi:hypothetical protein
MGIKIKDEYKIKVEDKIVGLLGLVTSLQKNDQQKTKPINFH